MLDIVGGLFDDRLKCAIRPDHVVKEYYRAQLAGKLLNIVGEIEKDAFVGSEFKDVVSCDTPVTARLPYQEPFVFIPQCAHLFAGNHLPATKDHSEGQRRRWRFFHFRHRVPEKNRIQYLGRKILKEESPGVLAWALSGAQRLMRNGGVLTPTGAHTDLLEKWKQSSDSVEAFLHDPEIVILGSGMRCYRQKAFDAYIDFCRESNYRGLSKYNFYHRVESIFSVSRKNSEERHFSGFSLVEKEFQF
jgi:putative DNA primase/helicase